MSMGILVAGLMVGGTVIQALAQRQQGVEAERRGEEEQAILEHNAKIKEREAEAERAAAEVKARKFAEEGEELVGEQVVGYAKGGVLAAGTPATVMDKTIRNLETEKIDILTEGYTRGEFRESEAYGLRLSGASAKARGTAARRGAEFAAAGTLLTGFGRAGYMMS